MYKSYTYRHTDWVKSYLRQRSLCFAALFLDGSQCCFVTPLRIARRIRIVARWIYVAWIYLGIFYNINKIFEENFTL